MLEQLRGDAELVMVPAMFKAVFGVSLDELGISLVSMSAAFFTHLALLFDDNRLNEELARAAEKNCPVSRALTGTPITVEASLAE